MISVGPNLKLLVDAERGEEHYSYLTKLLRGLDGLVQPIVKQFAVLSPTGTEQNGDMVVVASSGATGLFAGKENHIARFFDVGVDAPAWDFFAPQEGWSVRIANMLNDFQMPAEAVFFGGQWIVNVSGLDNLAELSLPVLDDDEVLIIRDGSLYKTPVSSLPHNLPDPPDPISHVEFDVRPNSSYSYDGFPVPGGDASTAGTVGSGTAFNTSGGGAFSPSSFGPHEGVGLGFVIDPDTDDLYFVLALTGSDGTEEYQVSGIPTYGTLLTVMDATWEYNEEYDVGVFAWLVATGFPPSTWNDPPEGTLQITIGPI